MSEAMKRKHGCFISFEGIDGAGKSTHVDACVQWLQGRGEQVTLTREPGGSPLAETLRGLLLAQDMQPDTEALLAFAARSDHLQRVIRPALAAGGWVVCDRFTDSTFAYQGGGSGVDTTRLATYLFDLPPEVAAARRAAVRAADRFEARELDYFARVRQTYLDRVAADPDRFVVLDATAPPDVVGARLLADLAGVHARWQEGA